MQSVLVGNGRRNYSTQSLESFAQQKPPVQQQETKTSGPKSLGASLTGEHIRPMEPGHDGQVYGYFLMGVNRAVISTGMRLIVLKLLYSWSANARVMALASVEVDLAPIPPGKTITITFRGKPVFIKHRTPKEIANIKADESNLGVFRDPELDADRFPLNPEWTVVLAICTHLGCVPVTDAGRWNAFFCPCHGSHYDASGRIRAGPAPLNLAVPPMKFTEQGTLVLGG